MSTVNSLPWIDRNYIELLLSKIETQGSAKLNDFRITSGSAQGENFAGVIMRVTVDYSLDGSDKQIRFILKTSPTAGAIAELLDNLGVFEAESFIYKNILKNALFPDFKMAPKLIHADDKAIVLEDLISLDFVLADRKKRFDLTRAKLVLKKLARFHAATALMHQKEKSLMSNHMTSPHDAEEMTPLSFFFSASFQESLETIRACDDLHEYAQFLESYDILKETKMVYSKSNDDRFHVLNHGDLWINNIFFKCNQDNEPIDVLFVDYQESYFGSPGIDFNHFLYTSCNHDVHSSHFDELIVYYYDNLVAALKQLNYEKIPSIDDIRYEIKNKAQEGLIALATVVPVQMIENPEHANPEYFLADTEEAQQIRREVYGNPLFVDVLKGLLPKLKARGIFNHSQSHF